MTVRFLDTETCGLTGPIILIQYAIDDGPVTLYEVWYNPVKRTLQLIEELCNDNICAFNLSFDWFHINKLYNLLYWVENKSKNPNPTEIASISSRSFIRSRQYCLKPSGALDLFLYSRKSEWQNLMDRRNLVIRSVPNAVVYKLAELLTRKITIPHIYFYKSEKGYHWDIEPDEPGFSKLTLRFRASGGLKPLCSEIFKCNVRDYPVDSKLFPEEHSYDPYTTNWIDKIYQHINHWHSNKEARGYAEDDVIYLQRLFRFWNLDESIFTDIDSSLACCVGAVRWAGYEVNVHAMRTRLVWLYAQIDNAKVNVNNKTETKEWLWEICSDIERIMVKDTSDETFKKIEKKTKNTSLLERIKHVQEIRKAIKEKDNLEKLVSTGSFNPDFKVIGAKNGRMSGGSEVGVRGGSFNPQGVQRERSFRTFFSLHRRGETLSGGDFKAFEVTILHGACQDEQLATDLKQGKAFHTTFGTFLYELSHEDIESTKGTSDDLYYKSKTGALATIYGAEPYRVGYSTDTSTERAKDAIDELHARYPRYRDFCEFIESRFQGMYQPGGLGTPVIWREPEDAVRSLLGFARYFTLENSVSRSLFELASHLPLKGFTETVTRKNRIQSAQGATQTALFAAAFNIRGQVVRAARNHVISSTGAYITKEVQNAIWSLQPVGVHEWYVKPFNVHDEVLVTHKPELANRIKEIVDTTVEKFREVVPLIAIDWKTNMESWADK